MQAVCSRGHVCGSMIACYQIAAILCNCVFSGVLVQDTEPRQLSASKKAGVLGLPNAAGLFVFCLSYTFSTKFASPFCYPPQTFPQEIQMSSRCSAVRLTPMSDGLLRPAQVMMKEMMTMPHQLGTALGQVTHSYQP